MLGMTLGPKEYFDRVCLEIGRLDNEQVEAMSSVILDAYQSGRFVFICGNGGSGANASHLSEDLAKCTIQDFENQKRLKVLSITDNTAGIMAWANDEGYDRIFVEQLKNLASPGDVLIAISGSGNSPNILRAVEWANRIGMTTLGMTSIRSISQQLSKHWGAFTPNSNLHPKPRIISGKQSPSGRGLAPPVPRTL
ncbi:MAG: SIS domain-containing protein, partial [Planctomycetota bacterium]|nr:SIS domain-containing protein [Planctomycetota bacterium]